MKNHTDTDLVEEVKLKLDKGKSNNHSVDSCSFSYGNVNTYELIEKVQRVYHPVKRVRECSTLPIPNRDSVEIYTKQFKELGKTTITSGFTGLRTCKSKTCLCCSNSVSAKQTKVVDELVGKALHGGLDIYFITLTQARTNDLEAVWNLQQSSFTEWKRKLGRIMKKLGYEHSYIANKDITFSKDRRTGIYNLHLHLLLFVDRSKSLNNRVQISLIGKDTTKGIKDLCKRLWTQIIKNKGGRATQEAQDVQEVNKDTKSEELASYVVKISKTNSRIAYEVTRNSSKQAKSSKNFGLFQLVEQIYKTKGQDKRLIAIYRQFTGFTGKGKQFFTKTRGIDKWMNDRITKTIDKTEQIDDKAEEKCYSLQMSQVAFEIITSLRLRGKVMTSMIGFWTNEHRHSRTQLELFSKRSIEVRDYNTKITQIEEIRGNFIMLVVALEQDNIITKTECKALLSRLQKSC